MNGTLKTRIAQLERAHAGTGRLRVFLEELSRPGHYLEAGNEQAIYTDADLAQLGAAGGTGRVVIVQYRETDTAAQEAADNGN